MSARRHWDAVYAGGDDRVSWRQDQPDLSLRAIRQVAPDPAAPILDVGGGSSPLAGALLAEGYRDVTVLDVSPAALELARQRLGARKAAVSWIDADLLTWTPPRRYALWHDRAVLHFFTDAGDRRRYGDVVREALRNGGHAVIATFALDGPDRCSGLPVRGSSPDEILDVLGPEFALLQSHREVHETPSGHRQPFTWTIARRGGASP